MRNIMWRSKQVPNSCIESAEYIMQCISLGQIFVWKEGCQLEPNIYAHFGNGRVENITSTPNFHEKVVGVVNYPFTQLPRVGEGLICLNPTRRDYARHGGYNMHLGAVVVDYGLKVRISNMMAPRDGQGNDAPVRPVDLITLEISDPIDFITMNEMDPQAFALGLLTAGR